MRKTIKYFLVFCLLMLTFPSSIFAEEVSVLDVSTPNTAVTRDLVAEEKLPTFALVFDGDDQIATKQFKADQKIDMESLKKEYLFTPDTFNKVENESSSKNRNFFDRDEPGLVPLTSPQALTPDGVSVVLVRSGLVVNNTQNPYLVIKIVGITGTPPQSMEAVNALYRNRDLSGNYPKITTLTTNWSAGQIWVGNSVTQNIANTMTYYYATYSSMYGIWANPSGGLSTAGDTMSESEILLNSLGQQYPTWRNVDVHGFLNATMPSTAQWATVPSSVTAALRNTFDSTVRSQFKTYYDQNYGYVNWVPTIEIHHIRPLQFGGGNDFYNLIPLHADIHSKFSFWFQYY